MWPASRTIPQLLEEHAHRFGERTAFTFLQRNGERIASLTYAQLWERACQLASVLEQHGVRPGERVLIATSYPSEFVPSFFATLLAGSIAVPTPAPTTHQRARFQAIVDDCDPAAAFAGSREAIDVIRQLRAANGRGLATLDPHASTAHCRVHSGSHDDAAPAFLQYTSGSTGNPRGVVVTHAAAIANLRMIRLAFGHDADSRFVGWLPLFHDMGLVGNVLQPFFLGTESVLMPAVAFLEDPLRWLHAIATHRAHTSGGPDFAYRACVRAAQHRDLDLDLSTWKVAFNGAEPVRASTLQAFSERFAVHGFSRESFLPCYGLAEATLLATGARRAEGPRDMRLSRSQLERNEVSAARYGEDSRTLVSMGPAVTDGSVLIVDPASGAALSDRQIGEIALSGPHLAHTYWNQPGGLRVPRSGFMEGFLHTGDLGFVDAGELFVTGRSKDLIIIDGRNLHPHDIEDAMREATHGMGTARGLALGLDAEQFSAAFGHQASDTREHLILLQEIERGATHRLPQIASAIAGAITRRFDVAADAIVLLKRAAIETTSSGKVRRAVMRERLCNGEIAPLLRRVRAHVAINAAQLAARVDERLHAGATQAQITDVLRELCETLLGTAPLPLDATFGELGVGSLQSMAIIQAIAATSGVVVPFEEVYANSSIARLGDVLHRMLADARLDSGARQAARQRDPSAIRSLWMKRAIHGDSSLVLGFTLWCEPQAAAGLLSATRRAVGTHRTLTTSYRSGDGGAVSGGGPLTVPVAQTATPLDASGFQHLIQRSLNEPFDLTLGPVRLLHATDVQGRCALVVLVHHIAADFHSLLCLLRDIRRHAEDGDAALIGQLSATMPHTDIETVPHGPAAVPRDVLVSPELVRVGHGGAAHTVCIDLDASLLSTSGAASTPFCHLLLAFSIAIARHTGTRDVSIYVPISVRHLEGDQPCVGYFARPVAVTVRLDAADSWQVALRRVGAAVASAAAGADTARAEPSAQTTSSHSDLAAVHMEVENAAEEALAEHALGIACPPVRYGPLEVGNEVELARAAEQAITLISCQHASSVKAAVRVSAAFLPATAALLAERISTCLRHLADPSPLSIGELLRIDAFERSRLDAWSSGAPGTCRGTLMDAFWHHCHASPGAAALALHDCEISYRELGHRVAEACGRLRRRLRRATPRVAILLSDPVQRIVAMLACLDAGGCIVPIDVELPFERVETLLKVCQCDIVLNDDACRASAGSSQTISWGALLDTPSTPEGAGDVAPASHAYVVFTSGSTGAPKAIEHTHISLLRFIRWQAQTLGIGTGTRVAQVSPPGFDVSLCEIFGALCVGATLCLPRRHIDLAPDQLLPWLKRARVGIAQLTPSYLSAALDATCTPLALDALACVGEPLAATTAASAFARSPAGLRLFNIYGPSEVIAATCHEVSMQDLQRTRIPIGRPLSQRRVEVRDEHGELVPIGQTGEIWITTSDMCCGYLGDPTDRFVTLPGEGAGVYRTGDLGAWTSDGSLEVRGRLDNQIKHNGVRIELEEIEACIRAYPQVQGCVAAQTHTAQGRSVLAVLVHSDPMPDMARLAGHCRSVLPSSHVPAFFIHTRALPLLNNRKLDRRSATAELRAALSAQPPACAKEPTSETETTVLRMWRQLLNADDIGADSNFFEVGGHSLTAMQFLNRVQAAFNVEIHIGDFLSNPTVSAVAAAIDAADSLVPA